MNRVELIGFLARDPELSYTPQTQTACARFTLAINRPKKNGQDQGADFIRVEVWGKNAENCNRYLKRGSMAGVSGKIKTGSYTNKQGVKVYTTDVVADQVDFLSFAQRDNQENNDSYGDAPSNVPPAQGGAAPAPAQAAPAPAPAPAPQQMTMQEVPDGYDDDLPDSFTAQEDDIPF